MSESIRDGSILIVEDDPTYRNTFEELLPKLFPKFKIIIVKSFDKAKQTIDQNIPFDIVLTDMRLVNDAGNVELIGGIEVVKYARSKDRLTQIIVITNHPQLGNVYGALAAGASYYIDSWLPRDARTPD